ncbi:hypothetical protein BH23GEM6_BH23GEM6_21630 [soil metagenome]
MATLVYALCALTSVVCAVLLLRGYIQTRVRLLLWGGLCFAGLAVNNVLLFVDLGLMPELDLTVWRSLPTLAGLMLLIYGLVWETR